MIKWDEKYSTGDSAIDRQHKLLFEIFNDFEESVNAGRAQIFIDTCFPLLESYAAAHFKFEEKCMEQHHCPVAQENKSAHQVFVDKIAEFKKIYEAKGYDDNFFNDMHRFIELWITEHIIGLDVHLKKCIHPS